MMIALLGAILVSVFTTPAKPVSAGGVTDYILIDATINPVSGAISVGGFSAAELAAFGIQPIHQDVVSVLRQLNQVHAFLNGTEITVDVDGQKLAAIQWNKESRSALFVLAESYGISLPGATTERVSGLLDEVQVEITTRMTAETSKPFAIQLSRPLQADVGTNGQVTLEGLPTGISLAPEVVNLAASGRVKNLVVCWNQGQVEATVNGQQLPSVTLYRAGVDVLNKVLLGNQAVQNLDPAFTTKVGIDASLSGAPHQTDARCGD
ncbi:hypothetical protein A2Z33_05860 [Candidatus Gottesmanbacteria bacterium RBG_16_52_11]|uniref:POTRA domain-containing protein n=1 Tax=Candidatus Gottesmanbacteria bacterium RBG_16_52_11 TaxID=1798374 RepID=A0A1F5YXW7_9BACT|nr:MAG: hypothetical protein A2Z33_05860 [Candidatus Gottesmanbacteria bacterium RBG_16_52_11]